MAQTWLWIGILTIAYLVGTVWVTLAFRRLGTEPPPILKWGRIIGAVGIGLFIVLAAVASICEPE